MREITCPECRSQRVATVETVLGLCDLRGVEEDGSPVHEDGTELSWDSQQPITDARRRTLLECRDCGGQWYEGRLLQDGRIALDVEELREVVGELLEWNALMGEWDAPAWRQLRALVHTLGLSPRAEDEEEDEEEEAPCSAS